MLPVTHAALAGMQANQRGLQVVAHNVANLHTDGYRARRYDQATDSVRPRHDPPLPAPEGVDPPPSDVDLAEEVVDLKRYELGYRAGAKVLPVADRMVGRLLDVFDDRES